MENETKAVPWWLILVEGVPLIIFGIHGLIYGGIRIGQAFKGAGWGWVGSDAGPWLRRACDMVPWRLS